MATKKNGFNSETHLMIKIINYCANIQNFHYLLSALKDEAKEVIEKIDFTADGYRLAWNCLVELLRQ